jgi:hypothetical protein
MLKVRLIEWLVFNACAPSNITFLVGFILFLLFKNRIVFHIAILPMFLFGTLGLLVFPWIGMNTLSQIGHLIMTLNVGWVIFLTFKTKDYKAATIGMLLGIVIFSIFIGFQQRYVATHPEDFKRIIRVEKPK